MQISITSRAWVVAALMGLSLLGGLVTGQPVFSDLAWTFMGLLLLALAWAFTSLLGIRVRRRVRSRRSNVGRNYEERFQITNNSRIPKLWVELSDDSELPNHEAGRVLSRLGGRQQYSWAVRTLCVQRGRFRLGPALLRSGDPFGLFVSTRALPATSTLVVYPAVFEVKQFATPVGSAPGGEALRRRTPFVTPNAAGVREYAVGDSLSRIHWKSTAKRDRLMVKEFELDPLGDVWLLLDGHGDSHHIPHANLPEELLRQADLEFWVRTSDRSSGFWIPSDTESYAVSATASLAQYFIRRDRPLGLVAYGQVREVIAPDAGERQLTRIYENLAVFQAQSDLRLGDVIGMEMHRFQRGSTVVLVTPAKQEQWLLTAATLRRRGLKVAVVVIDRGSFGGESNVDDVVRAMTTSRMPVHIVAKDDEIGEALTVPGGLRSATARRETQPTYGGRLTAV